MSSVIDAETLAQYLVVGELGLDGRVAATPGVLLAALHAGGRGLGLICPAAQGGEAAWAGSIAAHVALDALRGRMRERRFFERDAATAPRLERVAGANLERQLEARQQLEWLQKALANMNADQAETVLLHDVLGHGLNEIAAMMGVDLDLTR